MLLSERKTATLFRPPWSLTLEGGGSLGPVTVAYETFGRYDGHNAVLILHALTGDSHVAGRHRPDDPKPGWWDPLVGPGKAFDTGRYHIICSNVLGGCQGTTGPSSLNPATGRPYGPDFPIVTVRDMVRVQKALLDHLGIPRVLAVAGGSLGGMQALEWAIQFPDAVAGAIPIGANARFHAQGIAWNEVQRRAILADPAWQDGRYHGGPGPRRGLAVARMLGMITYRSLESMEEQFGRTVRRGLDDSPWQDFGPHFSVETYLEHQGETLVQRFDANSYLYLSKAMDLHDVSRGFPSYAGALARIQARMLVVGIRSDLLFPPQQQRRLTDDLRSAGVDVRYLEMDSPWGHDAFLMDHHLLAPAIIGFLAELSQAEAAGQKATAGKRRSGA
ncbi:MAG: homoserine O-acetyltransferase [Firmicutes bacterium]|nr:homoserine O-acetyltransferase [Bacillota bacterium]